MKKITVVVALALISAAALLSCEKDDICAEGTPTTPSLVMEFFFENNTTVNQEVGNLKYFIEGRTDTITAPADSTKIRVPLQVNATQSKWGFMYSYTPPGATESVVNIDYLTFNYNTQDIYVSRACGFKTVFNLDTDNLPNPVLTDAPTESSFWIQNVEVEKTNIEDENETHISIFF